MFSENHKKEMPFLGMLGMGGGIVRFGSSAADSYYFLSLGDTNSDQARSFNIGSDDAMYMAIRRGSTGFISKVDVDGALQWSRTTSPVTDEDLKPQAVLLDSSDNVYAFIEQRDTSGSPSTRKMTIFKYNSSGTIQSKKHFGDQTIGGTGLFLSGGNFIFPYQASGGGAAIIELNTSLAIQAQKNFGGSGDFWVSTYEGTLLNVDSSGNIYAAAVTNAPGSQKILLFKVNSSYTLQWQKQFDSGTNEDLNLFSSALDSSGNLYICGVRRQSSPEHGFLIKYNSSGTFQWGKAIGSTFDEMNAVTVDSNDDVYVAGRVDGTQRPTGCSGNPMGIIKLNSGGTVQWQRVFAGQDDIDVHHISINSKGSVVVYVTNDGTNTAGSSDVGILKVPADGSATGSYTLGSDTIKYESMTGPSISSFTGTETTPTRTMSDLSESITASTDSETSASLTLSIASFS